MGEGCVWVNVTHAHPDHYRVLVPTKPRLDVTRIHSGRHDSLIAILSGELCRENNIGLQKDVSVWIGRLAASTTHEFALSV